LPLQTVTVLFCNFFFFQSRIQIYSPKCSWEQCHQELVVVMQKYIYSG
jgi:hypothetical protein